MKTIKNFFSRFFQKKQNENTHNIQNDDANLKEIVHQTVSDVFQKDPTGIANNKTEKIDLPQNFNPKIMEILNQYNKVFFSSFRIPKGKYKIKFEKKNIIIDVENKFFENELSKSDKLSIAYEHIFQRIIQSDIKEFDYRLFLRAGQSAKKHHDYTVAFATKMAHKVKQTGRKVVIPSKSNYERSIIHHVIEEIDGVQSKSTGSNSNRNLIIYPEKNAIQQPL